MRWKDLLTVIVENFVDSLQLTAQVADFYGLKTGAVKTSTARLINELPA